MSNHQAKLKKLKDIYVLEKDQQRFVKTEKMLRKVIHNQKLGEHEVIKMIADNARNDIKNIDFLLAYDDELNGEDKWIERKMLFERRNNIKTDILDRFSFSVDRSIQKRIEESIDELDKRSERFEPMLKTQDN